MSSNLRLIAIVLGGTLVLATSAGSSPTPGVTATQILLGGTAAGADAPTGTAAAAAAAKAYFRYVNARGGVNGRRIQYEYLDDEGNPAAALEAAKRLVQAEKVFAVFNMLGTEQSLAARSFLNAARVPQLFVASGASTWGRDYRRYRWSIGFPPSYTAEGIIYGRYIAKKRPKARIAVLSQNDESTRDLLAGLKSGLAGKGKIVAIERYEPLAADVRPQMLRLRASNADTLMVFATGRFAVQAFVQAGRLKWKAQIFVNQAANAVSLMRLAAEGGANTRAEGAISVTFLKDPAAARWAGDPGIALYRRIMRKYDPHGDPRDAANVYGMAAAFTMVDTLSKAGRNLTRQGVLSAATTLNERNNPFLLPGIVVRTSRTDRFPIAQAQLERWHGNRWVPFGGVVTALPPGSRARPGTG